MPVAKRSCFQMSRLHRRSLKSLKMLGEEEKRKRLPINLLLLKIFGVVARS
jgi:hypothetical protein